MTSHLSLRMEFLAVGEELGWPRIPLRSRKVVPAGQGAWESFARANIRLLAPALRAAKVRRDNLRGEKDAPLARVVLYGQRLRYGEPPPEEIVSVTIDPRRQRMLDNLAKARAARAAKKEARA